VGEGKNSGASEPGAEVIDVFSRVSGVAWTVIFVVSGLSDVYADEVLYREDFQAYEVGTRAEEIGYVSSPAGAGWIVQIDPFDPTMKPFASKCFGPSANVISSESAVIYNRSGESWDDYFLHARVMFGETGGSAGVAFRGKISSVDAFARTSLSGYVFTIESAYPAWQIWKVAGGRWILLKEEVSPLDVCQPTKKWIDLYVVVCGSNIKCWLEGGFKPSAAIETEDTDFVSGKVGFVVRGAHALFDDVSVRTPRLYMDDFETRKMIKDSYDHSPVIDPNIIVVGDYLSYEPSPLGGTGLAFRCGTLLEDAHLAYRLPLERCGPVVVAGYFGFIDFVSPGWRSLKVSVSTDGNKWVPAEEVSSVWGQAYRLPTGGKYTSFRLEGLGVIIDNIWAIVFAASEDRLCGNVAGKVSLQGRADCSGIVTFDLWENADRTGAFAASNDEDPNLPGTQITLREDGFYILDGIPPGTYDIGCKRKCYLRKIVRNVAVYEGKTTEEVDFHLIAGDINGDNRINVLDLNLLKSSYGSSGGQARYNQDADIDNTGAINVLDLNLFKSNYGSAGDE
jgi:hypothetical protein